MAPFRGRPQVGGAHPKSTRYFANTFQKGSSETLFLKASLSNVSFVMLFVESPLRIRMDKLCVQLDWPEEGASGSFCTAALGVPFDWGRFLRHESRGGVLELRGRGTCACASVSVPDWGTAPRRAERNAAHLVQTQRTSPFGANDFVQKLFILRKEHREVQTRFTNGFHCKIPSTSLRHAAAAARARGLEQTKEKSQT